MHLADAFIQSDLQCIQAIFFFVSMCSLGIEPTTFALLTQCSNHWATGISVISTISDTVNMQQVKKLNESLFDVDQTGPV